MGYGDHSYDHDHGPGGYWEGREAEGLAYMAVSESRRQEREDNQRRPRRLTAEDERARKREIAKYRAREQRECNERVDAMSLDQIIRHLLRKFAQDFDSHLGSDNGRASIHRSEYNALCRRFLGAYPKAGIDGPIQDRVEEESQDDRRD